MFAVVRLADAVLMAVTVDATGEGDDSVAKRRIQSGWRVTWVCGGFRRREAK